MWGKNEVVLLWVGCKVWGTEPGGCGSVKEALCVGGAWNGVVPLWAGPEVWSLVKGRGLEAVGGA